MSQDKCAICLEVVGDKNIVILECKHKYHINCYTRFAVHKITNRDGLEFDEVEDMIKCPMCRKEDFSMYLPILDTMRDGIDAQITLSIFIEEIDDRIVREFLPHITSIINNKRFSKRSMINVMRKVIRGEEKELKMLLKDMKQN